MQSLLSRASRLFGALCLLAVLLLPVQGVHAETESGVTTVRARVDSVVSVRERPVLGIGIPSQVQTLHATILDGADVGTVVDVQNDYALLKVGQVFYALHSVDVADSTDVYTVLEPSRLTGLLYIALLFFAVLLFFGGVQGVRGLLSLVFSILVIVYVLLPAVSAGYSTLFVTIGVAALVVVVGSYITHGFRRSTTAAVIGMLIVVIGTGLVAYWAINLLQLTGFGSDEAVYLNVGAPGVIDFAGLLLGGILIGLLGVLYDAAIGQAVTVEEMFAVAPNASRGEVYRRAIRIGREHIGALINTLAIAYVGVALPLLLLFYSASTYTTLGATVSREIFAAELTRMMVGGIGVVLAVPVTTAVAVWLLAGRNSDSIEPKIGHSHHH